MIKKLCRCLLVLDSSFTLIGSSLITTKQLNIVTAQTPLPSDNGKSGGGTNGTDDSGNSGENNGDNTDLPEILLETKTLELSFLHRNDSVRIENYQALVDEGWELVITNSEQQINVSWDLSSTTLNFSLNGDEILKTSCNYSVCFSKKEQTITSDVKIQLFEYDLNILSDYKLTPGQDQLLLKFSNYYYLYNLGYQFEVTVSDPKICQAKFINGGINIEKEGQGQTNITVKATRGIFQLQATTQIDCEYCQTIDLDNSSVIFSSKLVQTTIMILNWDVLVKDRIAITISKNDDVDVNFDNGAISLTCKLLENTRLIITGTIPNGGQIKSYIDIGTDDEKEIVTNKSSLLATIGTPITLDILNLEDLNNKYHGNLEIYLQNSLINNYTLSGHTITINAFYQKTNTITLKYVYQNNFFLKVVTIDNNFSNDLDYLTATYAKNLAVYIQKDGELQFNLFSFTTEDVYKIIQTNGPSYQKIDQIIKGDDWKIKINEVSAILASTYQMWTIYNKYKTIATPPLSFEFCQITSQGQTKIPISSLDQTYFQYGVNIFLDYIEQDMISILTN